jgi:hypothetical protein
MGDQFAENLPPDRRHGATREELLARLVKEFNEMAGLSLTLPQACRLFDVRDRERCARVVKEAVERGLLQISSEGLLVRGRREG